ncbi:MAG: hypothetical protein LBG45_08575, partial [Dysgonamonadaceae bacterium]|nr:hypothetical protein [Dysgonamonadaceae bacterium]
TFLVLHGILVHFRFFLQRNFINLTLYFENANLRRGMILYIDFSPDCSSLLRSSLVTQQG